jgi:hypothetical protein
MNIFIRRALFCVVCLFVCVASHAQSAVVPRLVNFSGKATNAAGKPISGTVGATFSIYKEESGGAPLWFETQNVQADGNGKYTVQLGASKAEGLPLDLFTSGEARWLGVRIQGGEEQPRVLLLSVPYALKAADAETLGGKPASAFLQAVPSDPRATESPTAPTLPPTVHGNGTPNYIPLWTAKNIIGNSALFQSGGNIGIGTTAPLGTLDVVGSAIVRNNFVAYSTNQYAASFGESFGSAPGVYGWNTSTGFGVYGISTSAPAIWGETSGNTPGSDGVHGVAHGPGSGVAGVNDNAGGVGVWGQSPGWSFYSAGHASQDRASGGWIKALLFVNAKDAPYTILRCYNSTLMGATATTPPCGFTLTEIGPANFTIDIGFEIDDRFVSATPQGNPAAPGIIVTDSHTLNIIWYDLFAQQINGAYYWLVVY